jgi:RNA polymerase sigma-70 factor (ECF subfamily)
MNQAEHDLLVLQAQDGDRTAFEALVRLHHRDLVRFAFSLCGESATAQDAVQEAWLRIARRLRRLEDPRAFRGWLYHGVRWRVLDQVRRAHRCDESLEYAPEPADDPAPDERRDRALDLGRAVDRLPMIERTALQLYYVSGLGIAEIGVALDAAPGTVKSRLFRARERLKTLLEGEDDDDRRPDSRRA